MRLCFCWLLLLLPLAACGPSSEEFRARKIVEPSVVGIFQSLPHPPIAKVPMHSTFSLGGPYHGMGARVYAHYWTRVPGKKVCDSFLLALNRKLAFDTNGPRGKCVPRPWEGEDTVFHTLDGHKSDHRVKIHISATEEMFEGERTTEVTISLSHTLDKSRWRECIPNEADKVPSFCNSRWHRSLMPPGINDRPH